MCDFKPGDEVVCVDARPVIDVGLAPIGGCLIEGDTYTVLDVGFCDDLNAVVVFLAETQNADADDPVDRGYRASRFRKVQKRDLTAWLSSKQTFEEPKRAPAKKRERV